MDYCDGLAVVRKDKRTRDSIHTAQYIVRLYA
jgi:hypothetical protein